MKKIIYFYFTFLIVLSSFSIFPDSNGIWTYPRDIKAGVFGEDEDLTLNDNFTFNNRVYLNQELILSNNVNNNPDISFDSRALIVSGSGISLNINGDGNSLGYFQIANGTNDMTASVLFRILDNGNVGIGVSDPSQRLDVAGNILTRSIIDREDNSYVLDPSAVSFTNTLVSNIYYSIGSNMYYLDPKDASVLNNLDVVSLLSLNGVDINDIFVNENQANSISSGMIIDGTIGSDDLGENSVGGSELIDSYETGSVYDSRFVNENQVDSISSGMIIDGTIDSDDLGENSVGGSELIDSYETGSAYDFRFVNENQANSISSSMIIDGTIGSNDLGENSVGGSELIDSYETGSAYDSRFVNENQANSISSGMIVDGTITIDDVSVDSLDDTFATLNYVNTAFGGRWEKTGNNLYYNSGNVGIGTDSPESELEVAGTIRADRICDRSGLKCIDIEEMVDISNTEIREGISFGDTRYSQYYKCYDGSLPQSCELKSHGDTLTDHQGLVHAELDGSEGCRIDIGQYAGNYCAGDSCNGFVIAMVCG